MEKINLKKLFTLFTKIIKTAGSNKGYSIAETLIVIALAFFIFSAIVAVIQPEVTALNFKAREIITSIKGSGI